MINIAIDGRAGSGKSTIAKLLAEKLNFKMLNTGAIYRSIACAYKSLNWGEPNDELVEKFVENLNVEVGFVNDEQFVLVNGVDYSSEIRHEEISNLSSTISKFPLIREKILKLQQDFAKNNNCIIEGRAIGTVILPNADFKFFVTASVEVRAKRRMMQMKEEEGIEVPYNEILEDLKIRDYNDEHRKVAPLVLADDAIVVDTSEFEAEEAVEYCLSFIKTKDK